MAWEWHDRFRNQQGRFTTAPDGTMRKVPVSLKLPSDCAEELRQRACAAKREIGDYVHDALLQFWTENEQKNT